MNGLFIEYTVHHLVGGFVWRVLMAESEELLLEKLRKWTKDMEANGLRVNAG